MLMIRLVPNIWVRPPHQRKEADAAKDLLTIPESDHLTLMNVYNNYQQSELFGQRSLQVKSLTS